MIGPQILTNLRQNKLAALWLILVLALFLRTQADATQVTFAKRNGKIYVETDPKHYAFNGQVSDEPVMRIIAVDDEGQYRFTSECDLSWTEYKKIGANSLKKYSRLRGIYMRPKEDRREKGGDYVWTESFAEGEKAEQQQAVKDMGDNTFIYASEYFPSFLARVIISGDVVIYVKYNGQVRMKTIKCLYLNEKIFIEGIKKINPDKRMIPLLSSKADKVFRRHLKSNKFHEGYFKLEVDYAKTYTKAELAAMQNAIRGEGVRVFDGWGP